jgi:hypothetical protein
MRRWLALRRASDWRGYSRFCRKSYINLVGGGWPDVPGWRIKVWGLHECRNPNDTPQAVFAMTGEIDSHRGLRLHLVRNRRTDSAVLAGVLVILLGLINQFDGKLMRNSLP